VVLPDIYANSEDEDAPPARQVDAPKHYDVNYRRELSQQDIDKGFVVIKVDPYRIAKIYNLGGGAREQILKKALRWTTKGDSPRKVINEIMQACQRELEIMDEDGV